MKKYFPQKICAIAVLFSLMTSAHAALIARDWQTVNDAAITYDSATGLEWLDITVTAGLSYNDVSMQLGTGGNYEGFTFAGQQQIIDLFSAVNLQEIPNAPSAEGGKIQQLLSFWGVTWYLGTGERTEFLTSNTSNLSAGSHWTGRAFWLAEGDTGAASQMYQRDDNYKNFSIGSALVRTVSPVPVPAAFWLFGSGLLGLAGLAHHRKAV